MAKTTVELLSKNAYAKYLGVSEKAIRKAVDEGKIKKGWDADKQKIIKHLADKEYGFLHQVATPKPGISKDKLVEKIERSESPNLEVKKGENSDHNKSKSEVQDQKIKSPNKPVKKNTSKSEPDDDEEEDLDDTNWKDTPYDELLLRVKIDPDMPYSEIVRRQAIIDAALAKKKLEEMEDILVRREHVEKALFAFGRELKKALMGLPARVIDEILAAPNKVEALNIINEELTDVLGKFSNFESVRLSNK